MRKSKLNWLDAGCGYGHLVEEARTAFKLTNLECQIEAFGFDISKYGLSKSNEKSWLCRCDAHNIPFKTGTFDVVSAFDIVEHVSDPIRMLKEFHRVLQRGGLLILTTPSKIGHNPDPTHINEHLPQFWIEHLNKIGFKCKPFYIPVIASSSSRLPELARTFASKLPRSFVFYLEEPLRKLLGIHSGITGRFYALAIKD